MSEHVIFDIGAHTGEDTDFYLGKGFRTVAVECNPVLVSHLRKRFAREVRSGQLTVVDKAVLAAASGTVQFFVNEQHDDWSSLDYDVARKGLAQVNEVQVDSTSLSELIAEFGAPYYVKVDIELGDLAVAESLQGLEALPTYCSFEFHEDVVLTTLRDVGYNRFMIVNQWLNGFVTRVEDCQEGIDYWPGGFTGYHSGYFGRDLPDGDWVGYEEAFALKDALSIASKYGPMKNSWFDLHAHRVSN